MSHAYDTVIFDLDGTLLNTLEDLKNSLNHALSVMGFPTRTLEEVRLAVGNGARMLIRRSVPESVGSSAAGDAVIEEALSHFRSYYEKHCNDCTAPYDGILPMLQELKNRGFRLAVVSNKPDAAVKTLCSLYFSNWISVAIGEREGVRRKPAPDSVYTALRELNASSSDGSVSCEDIPVSDRPACGIPTSCISSPNSLFLRRALYVGDSDVDIATAAAADMDCISVTWGFRDEAFLRAHGASRIIHAPSELPARILSEIHRPLV